VLRREEAHLASASYGCQVASYKIGKAAELLGVSPDTVRRWADSGRLPATRSPGGRRTIDGKVLARFAASIATTPEAAPIVSESARNRFGGIVTKVTKDKVMAQVDIQAGPFRIVSLMSREAADELGLAPGVMAVASVKATNVIVEVPAQD
jgi:molybdopterin-binding protein